MTIMRALDACPLDDDIVDLIMTFCPKFFALRSMILVSKAFYNCISHAVACNIVSIVGELLPEALQVVRCPYGDYDRSLDPETMAVTCPEEDIVGVITAKELAKLQGNAEVIDALEDIYSVTQKDRTSRTSVLTPAESLRFRRAAYRIPLYCNVFPGSRYTLDELIDLTYIDDAIAQIERQRTALLDQYPADELLHIYSVTQFMHDIIEAVSNERYCAFGFTCLTEPAAHSPSPSSGVGRIIALNWPRRRRTHSGITILRGVIRLTATIRCTSGTSAVPLENIWSTRDVESPDEPAASYILDTILGTTDTCSQCTTRGGLGLLTEANWDHEYIHKNVTYFLRSSLKWSWTIRDPFEATVARGRHSDDLGPWIAGMFALKQTPGEWDGWEREMSYCEPCLTSFLEDHVWRWYLEERLKSVFSGMGGSRKLLLRLRLR
ncbi:hypothetical protein B0H13DRAFT_1917497 [Mycena leptocephala]|nr:hypothetical protein B0H13DRAFT_1917497 [Mycena leptocephala]